MGNIALEIFSALHLREEAANRQYSQLKAHSHILQHGQIYFVIRTNTFGYLDSFISVFGQEYFGIVTNTNVLAVFPAFLLWQPIGNILKLKALSSIEQLGENICAAWTNTF